METQDIIIGETYRLRGNSTNSYLKVIAILGQEQEGDINPCIIVKCKYTINKNDKRGFIRYFKAVDLVKDI